MSSFSRYELPEPAFPYVQTIEFNATSFGPSSAQQSATGSFVPPSFVLNNTIASSKLEETLEILVPTGSFVEGGKVISRSLLLS